MIEHTFSNPKTPDYHYKEHKEEGGNLGKKDKKDIAGCDFGKNLRNLFPFDLVFQQDGENRVQADFQSDSRLQGYVGIIHGGILSALLDTAMARCLHSQGVEAVTGALNVRFYEPVPCDANLSISAWVDESLPPLYHLRAEITVDNNRVCRAKAKFMQRNLS